MSQYLSVIIPVYNEEKNIFPLFNRLKNELNNIKRSYEIIFVDDGSNDKTFFNISKIKKENKNIVITHSTKNQGLSSALGAGFKKASGNIIITMDGDLQNDPKDIKKLLKELSKGYDVVCGWRYKRRDSLFIKEIPSKIFNFLLKSLFKLKIHDSSCTLRVYTKKSIMGLELLEGMHRFIPLILAKRGCKIGEVKVNHYPRIYEKAKYNSPKRFFRGAVDLIRLRFL